MLDIFIKYWLQWICGIVAAGIVIWAKHIIKLEKESVNRVKAERMKEMREEIVDELTEKIDKVEQKSDENDRIMKEEIEVLSNNVENLTIGVLSLQGKQFRGAAGAEGANSDEPTGTKVSLHRRKSRLHRPPSPTPAPGPSTS